MTAAAYFVVQTHPQRELFVEDLLSRFEPYLPIFKTERGRIAALFPGYLFVPAMQQWSPVKNCVGVRALLMAGDHPAMLHGKVIDSWRGRERNGLVQLPPPPRFRKGERLTITRGLLRHRTALYVGMSGKDRERVLIELLGAWVQINVATVDLVSDATPRHRLRSTPKTL